MYKIVEFSHKLIEDFFHQNEKNNLIFIDATCGHGNDTLKLAQTLNHSGKVVAYDIQEIAINDTRTLLENYGYNDITYHLESHDKLIETELDLIIYNLGFLPGSNKEIKTNAKTSLKSIQKALDIVSNKNAYLIIIVLYPGHKEGLEESIIIDDFCKNLPGRLYLVSKYQNYNRNTSPYIITISPNILK